jgi:hypothetical protein
MLNGEPVAKALAFEVASRLDQLDYLHAQVLAREVMPKLLHGGDISEFTAVIQCAIYAEAFYMFAFRNLDAIREINKRLFHKSAICTEPKGVRDVRNHLIIHPENLPQPVLNRSFQMSKEDGRGIILKSFRSSTERTDFVDAGYRANAAEFRDFVKKWILAVYQRTKPADERSSSAIAP